MDAETVMIGILFAVLQFALILGFLMLIRAIVLVVVRAAAGREKRKGAGIPTWVWLVTPFWAAGSLGQNEKRTSGNLADEYSLGGYILILSYIPIIAFLIARNSRVKKMQNLARDLDRKTPED